MKKTLKFIVEVDLEDFSSAELRASAKEADCKVADLPTVKDIYANDIADSVAFAIEESEEFWCGSGYCAHISGARAREAEQ